MSSSSTSSSSAAPRRHRLACLLAATTAALAVVLVGSVEPAAAAAPQLVVFNPETIAVQGEQNPPSKVDQIRATVVIRHDVGVTVTGMKGWHSRGTEPGSYASVASYGGTVRTISGGSNYSLIEASFDPGNDNWMGSSCGSTRTRDVTARMDFQMSDGTTFTGNSWALRALAINGCGGPEDPATMENNYDSTLNTTVAPGGNLRIHYICDDGDSSGDADACDNVIISLRNAATNARVILACNTGTVPCENTRQFNADDNTERNGTVPVPAGLAQGRWLIEGDFCAETQRNAALTECLSGGNNINFGRQQIGSFYLNPSAPTVSIGTPTFTGGGDVIGGVIRPDTGATVNYTATTSSDAQVASWDLDGNGSYETVRHGETDPQGAPVLSATQKVASRSTAALAAGSSCAVGISVRDNGGINAADPSSSTATASSATCRVNTPPTGANQGPLNATKGTALAIALANSDTVDGDTRTCEVVSGAAKGTVSGFPSCSVSYTAAANQYGSDSFTYRVRDDHEGVSATYTVSLAIVNRTPSATAQSIDADAGAPTAITLAGTDLDGDSPLTCAPSTPGKGALTGSGCARTYTSNPGEGGADSFTFTVADAAATSSAATVGIAIANPDLSLTKSHTGRFNEGVGTGTYTLTVANTTNAPANGTTTLTDTLPAGMVFRSAGVGSSGFVCAATPGVSTTVSCTRTTPIAEGASLSLTITVDVAAGAASPVTNIAVVSSPYELAATAADNTAGDPTEVNHRPTAADGTVSTAVDAPVLVTMSATDPDGDALTYAIETGPTSGSLSGSGATRQYVPNTGFQGVDTFTFTVTDTGTPGLVSVARTVRIYVGVADVVGVVTDEVSGLPVSGVEARLVDMADPQAGVLKATVVTNGAGAYDFGPVAFGTYGIRFVDPSNDHISEWFDDAPTSATANLFTLDDSAASLTRSVALRPGGRITGTVRSTVVPNAPIEGLQVRLVKIGSTGSQAKTTTAGGGYAFELLQPGSYQLWFRDLASGQWISEWYGDVATQAESTTIEVTVGQQVTIDEQISPVAPPPPPDSGSVTGTVTDSVTGAPLAGVQVRLYKDPYTGSASTTTDSNGQYAFTRLAPASYRLWFRDMTGTRISEYGGDASTLAEAETLTLANDGFIVDAALAPKAVAPPANSGVISGSVLEVDGFTPVVGLQVRLYAVGGTGSKATTTAADGSYSFPGLAPGQYQIWFRDLGRTWFSEWHLDAATQAASTAVTAANGQTTDIDAVLNRR